MPLTEKSDDELVRAAQQGGRDAFDELVERHGRAVLRCADGFARGHADAEDLAQEALFQAYRRLETFQAGTNFKAWLLTIAYRTCIHARRKKSAVSAVAPEHLQRVEAPQTETRDGELEEAVRRVVATLPEEQRIVVQLRFTEDLSHAEIAQITDSEEATVRWRLYQARQTLQKALKPWAPNKVEDDR